MARGVSIKYQENNHLFSNKFSKTYPIFYDLLFNISYESFLKSKFLQNETNFVLKNSLYDEK